MRTALPRPTHPRTPTTMTAQRPCASPFPALLLAAGVLLLAACGSTQRADDAVIQQSEYHYQLAVGHFNAREVPIAIRELFQSLELNPENAQAHFLLGFIYHGRRDYRTAIGHYEEALRLQPGWHEVRNNLGVIHIEQQDWDAAVELYRELINVPTYQTPGHAFNNLGWALYNQGHHHEAREFFRMAVDYQPEHCLAWNNLGLVNEELGDLRTAQRAYEQAIRRCSSYAEPRFRLGVMLFRDGSEVNRAVSLLRECIDLAAETRLGDRCEEFLALVPPR